MFPENLVRNSSEFQIGFTFKLSVVLSFRVIQKFLLIKVLILKSGLCFVGSLCLMDYINVFFAIILKKIEYKMDFGFLFYPTAELRRQECYPLSVVNSFLVNLSTLKTHIIDKSYIKYKTYRCWQVSHKTTSCIPIPGKVRQYDVVLFVKTYAP